MRTGWPNYNPARGFDEVELINIKADERTSWQTIAVPVCVFLCVPLSDEKDRVVQTIKQLLRNFRVSRTLLPGDQISVLELETGCDRLLRRVPVLFGDFRLLKGNFTAFTREQRYAGLGSSTS